MTKTAHIIPSLEAVLTTSELAAHLGVPVQTIHDLRHAHRGPRGFRVGREMRYRVSEVQRWVEALESQDQAADRPGGEAEPADQVHRRCWAL
ncbi:helix-turn-helix domain-containing protein [Cryobacterium gelidum]|uniref:DNA-binding protein n=1 Tax=Cryobacterium gelidum TaxID=1259164 RepID=A0A4R9B174_9MICO|nr:helix-turn-helix domain-containing protein [Cryobacterium gelidum]TFD73802.1 DNA-binding protein [Cryobacterium gelidum]